MNEIYHHIFMLLIVITLPVICLTGCTNHEKTTTPPNIIFIVSDDHASHAVSAYGSEIIETPNIDRLAREGIIFHNAFVTNSICALSRAVLLTGKHSHNNEQLTNAQTFDGSQITYPRLLQQADYRTGLIGKWHLRSDPTGYDHWDILPGQGHYYNPEFITPEGTTQYEGYVTDIIVDKVIEWIEGHCNDERPFMVSYHHKAPHRNWKPGPDQLGMFDNVDLPEPATLFANWSGELSNGNEHKDVPSGEWRGRTSAVQAQKMTLMDHFSPAWDLKFPPDSVMNVQHTQLWKNRYERFTDEQRQAWDKVYNAYYEEFKEKDLRGEELLSWVYQRYVKDYLTTIVSVDDNLGRLLDYLEETGSADNTIVVYTSDQGFYLGDHGWYDKRWMYEESLHIPLVMRWPEAIAPGIVNNDLVQNLDFAPTLIDLAGLEIPDEMQGRSLVSLMRGETPGDWRQSIYYHYYEYPGEHAVPRHYGVRTHRYKLTHYYQIDEWELFDLESDPDELNSVCENPDYSDIRAELKVEVDRLREQYKVSPKDPI